MDPITLQFAFPSFRYAPSSVAVLLVGLLYRSLAFGQVAQVIVLILSECLPVTLKQLVHVSYHLPFGDLEIVPHRYTYLDV